jgi:hypothetical protein
MNFPELNGLEITEFGVNIYAVLFKRVYTYSLLIVKRSFLPLLGFTMSGSLVTPKSNLGTSHSWGLLLTPAPRRGKRGIWGADTPRIS